MHNIEHASHIQLITLDSQLTHHLEQDETIYTRALILYGERS